MLALVLSLAVTQLGVGQHPTIDSQRGTTRVRAGIAATGGVFLVQAGGWAPGFGAVAELGAVIDDQLSLSIRPQLFTNIGFWLLGLTAGIDRALGERFSLGGGVAFTLSSGLDTRTSMNVLVPVRLTFAPFAREPNEVRRSGLLLGLEVAGGLLVWGIGGRGLGAIPVPQPSFSSLFTVGYAWW